MSERHRGISWPMMVAVATWAVNFLAIKLLYREMTPAAATLVRMLPMWFLLMGVCLWQKEPLSVPPGDRWRAYIQGFFSLGVYMILFFEGLARTGGAEGAILLSTSPIWTALIAMAAKQERFRPLVVLGALIAFGGVSLVIIGGQSGLPSSVGSVQHLVGVGLVLFSALLWAWTTVISKPLLVNMSPLRLLTASMPAALLVLIPYGISDALATPWMHLTPIAWLLIFHVVVLAGVGGFWGFYVGVKQVGPAGAMLYQYFVPSMAAVLEWLFIGRSLSWLQIGGFVVVIAGVYLASRARSPVAEAPQAAILPEMAE